MQDLKLINYLLSKVPSDESYITITPKECFKSMGIKSNKDIRNRIGNCVLRLQAIHISMEKK